MDYEKKYKEALRQAEETIKYYKERNRDEAAIEDLQEIFPELKESEDELTWLTKYIEEEAYWLSWDIRDDEDRIKLKKLQESLAWLEKQGEQILANSCKTCKDEPFDYENATIIQKDFAPKADMPRYSIGDVLCDKSCTMLNKESQSNFEITDIRNGMYICDKCSFPISQQDEYELVAKRIEQKPAWSEEDELMFLSTIQSLELTNGAAQIKINWLKSIKQRIGE